MKCIEDCRPGAHIMVINCSWNPEKWRFLQYGNGEFQIKLHGDNLCLEMNLNTRKMYLEECAAENRNQFFVAPATNIKKGDGFELSPVEKPNLCLSQDHHPKNYEEVFLQPCNVPRRADTSLWELY